MASTIDAAIISTEKCGPTKEDKTRVKADVEMVGATPGGGLSKDVC